ncbi:CHAT domain-containing protein [Streptomyces synnematoformans]|uniref:CHAT domain-containing protein n=1 Tax=Streptomyces synnematoformans TaxID=415721 RepID=A0ABP4K814_9ACTN
MGGAAGESGGVRAVRAWADEAIGRAKELLPKPDAPARLSRAHHESVAELDELHRLLDHDPRLRCSVAVWLGGALTLRHGAGGGSPADRERAGGLLRHVRDPATETGAAAGAEDRRWAALFLLTHALPLQEMLGGLAPEPDVTALFDMVVRAGPDGIAPLTAEVRELVADAAELPLPPETLRPLLRLRDLFAEPSADGLTDLFTSLLPDDGSPAVAHLRRQLTDLMSRFAGGAAPSAAPPAGPGTRTGTGTATGGGAGAGSGVGGPAAGTGAVPRTPEDVRRLLAAWQAVHTASVDFVDHAGGGDPAALNQQLARLRAALDGLPEGTGDKDALVGTMAMLLTMSDGAGGTLADQKAGHTHTRAIADYLRRASQRSVPMADGFAVMADQVLLLTDIRAADQDQDEERLRELEARASELVAATPEDHDFRFAVLVARALARLALGRATLDKELLLAGLADFEAGRAGAENSNLPAEVREAFATPPEIAAVRSFLTGDAAGLPDRVVPPPDAPAHELHSAANKLEARYHLTRDPDDLDAAVTTLERLREHIRQGRAPRVAARALWSLADAYRTRWLRERNTDVAHEADAASGPDRGTDAGAATDAANEALAALAADVLLQQGAEHRLATARHGASLGVRAALWAAVHGRVGDAVAALETGRALVLQAAATSRAVPDLLAERGRHDLAAAWRESGAADDTGPPAELPSTLRREALEELGYRERGGLLGAPTLQELADGVDAAGADALIYLVPGSGGDAPGMLLAVGPEIGVGVGALPALAESAGGPLERYLDAAAALSGEHADEGARRAAAQAREDALAELCDWAYEVVAPVLAGLDEHLPGDAADRRTPRVALVPCGRLGVVPWHAARFPEGAPYDYLCQALVITYAASGRQFLRTAGRAPRDPVSAPALVADPTLDLAYAEPEVLHLRNTFYPGARLYGDFGTLPPGSVPEGTPAQLLALLAQDHSMVHLATHGMAGVRPTESALHLAATGADERGRLTVTRLLDRPVPDGQERPDGPLIVLSACETDLSTRDHDEALTLTTAFVAGGARDVVGSRWTVQDSASILLMAVFHHHLRAGRSPVDALRAAQLWMLDPDREDPGCLSGTLRSDIGRPDLRRPSLWAAFIHQGHPGRGEETV